MAQNAVTLQFRLIENVIVVVQVCLNNILFFLNIFFYLEECKAGKEYFHQFEETLQFDFPAATGPAAFLAESIQGISIF